MKKFIKILFIVFCFLLQNYILSCNIYTGDKDSSLKHKFSAELNAIYPHYFLNNKYSNYKSNYNYGLGIGFSIDLFKGPNFNIGLSYTTKNYNHNINDFYFDIARHRIKLYNLSLLTFFNLTQNLSVRTGFIFNILKSHEVYYNYNNTPNFPHENPYVVKGLSLANISIPWEIQYQTKIFKNIYIVFLEKNIIKCYYEDYPNINFSVEFNIGFKYYM